MIRVQVRPNETVEAALRRFKRQCNYAGIFRLSKKYSYYEKESDRRRREERERIRNIQRALRKQQQKSRVRQMKRSKVKAARSEGDDNETPNETRKETSAGTGSTNAAAETAPRPQQPRRETAEPIGARSEAGRPERTEGGVDES